MIDPNLVYIILIAGLWLLVTAIHVPGTGALEVLTVVALIAAVAMLASMSTNWGMAVIVVAGTLSALVIPFFGRQYAPLAIVGLIAAAFAAYWLFDEPRVAPTIILLVTGVGFVFHRFALLPALDRQTAHPAMLDDQSMIGTRGVVQRTLTPGGTVYARGEAWSARAVARDARIESGTEIVVVEREGLTLIVEAAKQKRIEDTEVDISP
ncbi:MAG: NfeD family protein [Chloroflexota bacterium]|nr:NfeD family protein [Chloroflexota bacterium]